MSASSPSVDFQRYPQRTGLLALQADPPIGQLLLKLQICKWFHLSLASEFQTVPRMLWSQAYLHHPNKFTAQWIFDLCTRGYMTICFVFLLFIFPLFTKYSHLWKKGSLQEFAKSTCNIQLQGSCYVHIIHWYEPHGRGTWMVYQDSPHSRKEGR